jgi:hypothetical protein
MLEGAKKKDDSDEIETIEINALSPSDPYDGASIVDHRAPQDRTSYKVDDKVQPSTIQIVSTGFVLAGRKSVSNVATAPGVNALTPARVVGPTEILQSPAGKFQGIIR